MTVEQMRRAVRKVYHSDKWFNKVAKMSDNQVIAIYNKMLESGKLNNDGNLVVSFPRHAGRDEMMANRIAVDLALGKDVTVIRKNRDVTVVKRDGARSAWACEEPQTDGYVAKQVTFDDLWRNAGYSYVGTSEFMEGATSEDSSECSDDAFGEPRTDEIT